MAALRSEPELAVDELSGALQRYTLQPPLAPEPPKAPSALRHAEKNRTATCAFADRVAAAVVAEYNVRRPQTWKHRQTVVAGIVACRCLFDSGGKALDAALSVLSIGVGTKFLCAGGSPASSETVRDMHAEVLARRGFVRLIHQEVERCLMGEHSDITEEIRGSFRIRADVTFHFYTSSVPCGNASWKRWAKGGGAPSPTGGGVCLPWPQQPHARLQVHARPEGQVSFLTKHFGKGPDAGDVDAAVSGNSGVDSDALPMGTAMFCGDWERSCRGPFTCSDKFAKWNALGLQGSALSNIFGSPIRMASCTVGRKFSYSHCVRALCCRLQDFVPERLKSLPPHFRIHHPVLLGCSVKLDDGVYEDDDGADFTEHRCLAWCKGDPDMEVLDGRTGLTEVGTASRFANSSLVHFAKAWIQHEPSSKTTFSEAMGESSYREAKKVLRRYVEERCFPKKPSGGSRIS